MIEAIRDFIQLRGAQLAARYIGMALAMLATYLGCNLEVAGPAGALASLAVSGLLHLLDHYSHAQQAGATGGK